MSIELSMIIANYGSSDLALACIQSIRSVCTSVDYELILVDSKSPFSEDIRNSLSTQVDEYVALPDNRGYGYACNAGASRARGECLLFLNNDTVLTDNFLPELLSAIKDPESDIGAAGIILADMLGEPTHSFGSFPSIGNQISIWINNFRHKNPERNRLKKMLTDGRKFSEVDYITGAVLFIPRNVFEAAGGFDERFFMYFEDVELQHRIAASGHKIVLMHRTGFLHAEGNGKPRNNRTRIWTYTSLRLYFSLTGGGKMRIRDALCYGFMMALQILNFRYSLQENVQFFKETSRALIIS